ncbi:MAG: SRPBCC family protein [Chloroflexota bacterium]|nr:SRPBCC family protein [Chloroflexota bacterium]MDQ5865795.1 SRPBCC family protein [Chloroflexota bacterium]
MPTVQAAANVQGSAQEVFDFLADYRNIPRVQPQFNSAKLVSDRERCVGACVELAGRFHGMPMQVQNRIVTYSPPYRLASISEGTVLSRNVWELQPLPNDPNTTRVTFTVDYKVGGALGGLFTGIAASLFNKEIQAMTDEALRNLRGFFASGPSTAN